MFTEQQPWKKKSYKTVIKNFYFHLGTQGLKIEPPPETEQMKTFTDFPVIKSFKTERKRQKMVKIGRE